MSEGCAPPPTRLDGDLLAVPDVERVDVTLRFDVAAREATARAAVGFVMDGEPARPVLDLRQHIDQIRLDGATLPDGAFPHVDLGGGPRAEMRALEATCDGGHVLEVDHRLATHDAAGAVDVGWEDGGVRFDLWMSDLEPGRYLEMWVPAPLCHDRFALSVEVEVTGTDRPHVVVANGAQDTLGPGRWRVRYPARYTSLSPMLVIAPADAVEQRRRPVALPDRSIDLHLLRHLDVDADLAACEADVASWLPFLASRYGPWIHGDTFTAFIWGPGRGMEYDGATTAAVGALEHEVFHSWFGRGVKPAHASDGWIDEAYTSWATASRRSELSRFAEVPFDPDEPPVVLHPEHPWSRHTPTDSYGRGARLFAGLAHALGGAGTLRSAMADWYRANAGGLVTTAGLSTHLASYGDLDTRPWWDRWVYGRE